MQEHSSFQTSDEIIAQPEHLPVRVNDSIESMPQKRPLLEEDLAVLVAHGVPLWANFRKEPDPIIANALRRAQIATSAAQTATAGTVESFGLTRQQPTDLWD